MVDVYVRVEKVGYVYFSVVGIVDNIDRNLVEYEFNFSKKSCCLVVWIVVFI